MEIEKVDNNTQQSKKQVRRRLQTNKPYKDRLLNMAEARREIATALKFHRASMKQQEGNYVLQQHPPPESNSRLFPATTTTTTANSYLWSYSGLPFPPPIPPPLHQENLNFVLPTQTLGLNLNFQDFSNLKTPMAVYSSSSASSSPLTSSTAAKEVAAISSCGGVSVNMSPAYDDDGDDDNDDEYHPFDQVMEFPPWLINANESSCLQQFYDHQFSDQYSPDPTLPCMDIGEIEGMDGEWLA
ncbi:uncharacterized protein LOC111893197 [Lactuca sativa]|uniref:uncharacterized protein LOC111893197 n=1 Tax=Lactuca sativa TaxID=4236 RepID=UPI000CD83388|nr:uncharacterized protein LOC111893197 [Lactuca sativa]